MRAGFSAKTSASSTVKTGSGNRRGRRGVPPRRLSAAQAELVRICEFSALQFGVSRSVGHLFGIVYSSPVPLSFRELTELAVLSKGSVSQGLRVLRDLQAIRTITEPGKRRIWYAPGQDLKKVLARLLRDRLRGPLEGGAERLHALKTRLHDDEGPGRDFLFQRLSVIQGWHRRIFRTLPLVERAIEGNGS